MILDWLFKKIKAIRKEKSEKYISKLLTPEKFGKLEELIGTTIKNKTYFIQALVHRSFLEQNDEFELSNERLEFLGDSVLNLAVADYLYENYPDKDEGFLTKVRAKLVNRITLAAAADKMNLADFLLLSKNLSSNFNAGSRTVLCDAFEALIGAVYLDSGLDSAKDFINKVLILPSSEEGIHLKDENFKSQLLEYAQAHKLENPVYEVIKEEGPHHNRIFTIRVNIGTAEYGVGKGKNKKSAEQNAAQAALNLLAEERNSVTTY
jgi:ribonuclease III